MESQLQSILQNADNRTDFWKKFLQTNKCQAVAELGVFKGKFAEEVLRDCPEIQSYTLIDPWRNLEDWNKPMNKRDSKFEGIYQETMRRTEFAAEKRIVLRGKTTEIIDEIPDGSLDWVYIDGDHTLKGISIDLINMWEKVKPNGFIGGDDFSPTIWQHEERFEPTMVFPFAVYFAEAMRTRIYGLPFNQFLITKEQNGFEFIDLTKGEYSNTSVLIHLNEAHRRKEAFRSLIPKGLRSLLGMKKR